ncbi:MAG: hypothetical protein A3F84_13120 [Candidatus Handelsmanbacteria bacterium RIFCSPLOWO2_12_FULL_64_10]|uniref:FAD-binding PCMH-type domain-containing protein n=1 Tax=Handelsmanbacteria sp. (strain RIFCSPLOWO2_12_FULL_64_10) TaxID=1817868 RepID=A0A1F6D0D0_HANXR|nr:MAG: hypothetical protein A3F84_13120 [Candidatus Handelsmanbacteria bacterium RIFCSPLOWO2_12_FULL_64_10]
MVLPPNVSRAEFERALRDFAAAVGAQWVMRAEDDMNTYRDPYSPFFGEPSDPVPSAAVAPQTTEQVQEVVRIAGRYNIPLWTVSTGKNLGYGTAAPRLSGSVVVDLKRMNRILEVNEKHAYALVEPGVNYYDLYNYIREKGYKLWLDVASPGWGSVLGNAIERGIGYTPYGDHFAQQSGMEVVLPDGELLRTGMGAMPAAKTWQQFRYGYGPYLDGLFTQTSLGIVTKMGIGLMPEPPAYRSCMIMAPRKDDLVAMVDTMRPLRQADIIANISNLGTGHMEVPDPRVVMELMTGKIPEARHEDVFADNGVGYWNNRIALYGMPKAVEEMWEHVRDVHSNISGIKFSSSLFRDGKIDPEKEDFRVKLQMGYPSMAEWSLMGPSDGHLFFSPIIPFEGAEAARSIAVCDKVSRKYGTRYFGGPYLPTTRRSLLVTMGAGIKKGDPEFNRRTIDYLNEMIVVAAENGWGEYRTPLAFMDQVMDTYSYNNHALRRFQERLKDAIDPRGILSPGKNGIWPQAYRAERERGTRL